MPDATPPTREESAKDRWRVIIFGAETPAGKLFDIILLVFIGVSVMVVMLESIPAIRAEHSRTFFIAEWIFTIAFTLEYGARLWCSGNPLRYARSFFGIVDLLSILPTYLALFIVGSHYLVVIRILRMLRMFRVLKMVRHVDESNILLRALVASRQKITVFIIGVGSLIIIMGTLMYIVEGPEHGFNNIPVSVYWAIVTITTVGFGDITPQTPLGQLLSALMMITGYAIIAVPTGIVGAEIYGETQRTAARTTRRCPVCESGGHTKAAKFCKDCGTPLE